MRNRSNLPNIWTAGTIKYLHFFTFLTFLVLGCSENKQATARDGGIPVIGVEVAFPNLSFDMPLDLHASPDSSNRLFVVQQTGSIMVFENQENVSAATVFLDISDRIDNSGWEMGLLGMAFHPDFAHNGYFFVNYTAGNPRRTVISRFQLDTADSSRADNNSEHLILSFEQPFANHNGGGLAFGPDGFLYIGTGDGGSAGDPNNNGQNRATLLGKMLRIDVNSSNSGLQYTVPADNPYVDNDSSWREEIWAYGLRNPWRYSFDSTGRLWAGDVGQNKYEEIDTITKGGNYGWRIMEGSHCYNPPNNCDMTGLIMPVTEYPQPTGASVTGGHVYYGSAIPLLRGNYIYADFMTGIIWSAKLELAATIVTELLDSDLQIASFGIDQTGELLICSFDGKIYRMKQIGLRQ